MDNSVKSKEIFPSMVLHFAGATGQTWGQEITRPEQSSAPSLKVEWDKRVEGPYGHKDYCDKNPASCDHIREDLKTVVSSPEDLAIMDKVNRDVNKAITPMTDEDATTTREEWRIPVDRGDCEDFALLKIERLKEEAGLACSVAVVKTPEGEGHAVAACAAEDGNYYILDVEGKAPGIEMSQDTPYEYTMINDPINPRRWHPIQPKGPGR